MRANGETDPRILKVGTTWRRVIGVMPGHLSPAKKPLVPIQ